MTAEKAFEERSIPLTDARAMWYYEQQYLFKDEDMFKHIRADVWLSKWPDLLGAAWQAFNQTNKECRSNLKKALKTHDFIRASCMLLKDLWDSIALQYNPSLEEVMCLVDEYMLPYSKAQYVDFAAEALLRHNVSNLTEKKARNIIRDAEGKPACSLYWIIDNLKNRPTCKYEILTNSELTEEQIDALNKLNILEVRKLDEQD